MSTLLSLRFRGEAQGGVCESVSVSAVESRRKLDRWREKKNPATISGVGLQLLGPARAGHPCSEKVSSMAR